MFIFSLDFAPIGGTLKNNTVVYRIINQGQLISWKLKSHLTDCSQQDFSWPPVADVSEDRTELLSSMRGKERALQE